MDLLDLLALFCNDVCVNILYPCGKTVYAHRSSHLAGKKGGLMHVLEDIHNVADILLALAADGNGISDDEEGGVFTTYL